MKASIDLSAVADQLADCKPGDEYTVTFVVDSKTDTQLTGTASEVEHLDDYDDLEEGHEDLDVEGHRDGAKKDRLPKAILMVSR